MQLLGWIISAPARWRDRFTCWWLSSVCGMPMLGLIYIDFRVAQMLKEFEDRANGL